MPHSSGVPMDRAVLGSPCRARAAERKRMGTMIDAGIRALVQMFSPPFRWVLLKSAGLALAVIVLLAIGLHRLLVWLASAGAHWAETMFGISAPAPISILLWVLSIAAGIGIIVGFVFLMPAVTALVGSFFVDEIALEVEHEHYPAEPVGTPLPLPLALVEGMKTALLAVLVYIIAVPFLLFAGAGVARKGFYPPSFVTATRTVPSISATTRNVLASNSMPTRRRSVTAGSTRTPSVLLRKSEIAASMLLRAFVASGTRSTTAFSANACSKYGTAARAAAPSTPKAAWDSTSSATSVRRSI